MLEAVFSLFIFIQFLMVLLTTLYLLYLKVWIPHALYENNICRISYGNTPYQCHNTTKNLLKKILFHESFKISTKETRTKQSSQIQFKTSHSLGPVFFREEIRK